MAEPEIFIRKWEAVQRSFIRLEEFYKGKIDTLDSFASPRDSVYAYFHSTYSLKEALKSSTLFKDKPHIVESFINNTEAIALGIDISNTEKHGALDKSKTGKVIGPVLSHLHLLDPSGKDRTEMTVLIDDIQYDCLDLAKKNFNLWKDFLKM